MTTHEGITTRIITVDPRELKLLDINARYMPYEQYQRLVDNIRRDGRLTSVPFAVREPDGRYLVLSGNHRTKAAIEAGLREIDVMVTDDELSRQKRIAIQLSHNAIAGQDDPAILKELYDELDQVDERMYSGLDDKTLQLMENVQVGALSEANLAYMTVMMTFLPEEVDHISEVWEDAKKNISTDEVWLAGMQTYERAIDAIDMAGKAYGVSNIATSLEAVVRVFENHREDLQEGYIGPDGEATHDKWVPLASVFGTDSIPADVAANIVRVIQKMRDRGDLGKGTWKALEYVFAEYWTSGMPVSEESHD